jgi:hypothetical protein
VRTSTAPKHHARDLHVQGISLLSQALLTIMLSLQAYRISWQTCRKVNAEYGGTLPSFSSLRPCRRRPQTWLKDITVHVRVIGAFEIPMYSSFALKFGAYAPSLSPSSANPTCPGSLTVLRASSPASPCPPGGPTSLNPPKALACAWYGPGHMMLARRDP